MKIEVEIITKACLEVDNKYSFLDDPLDSPLSFPVSNQIKVIEQLDELKKIITEKFNISEEDILSIGSEKEEWYTKI